MGADNDTLTDRWLRKLKDNPVVAAIIVVAIIFSTVIAFWNSLPRTWRDWAADHLPGRHETQELHPKSGWIFAGYTDKNDELTWASEQRVRLMKPSGGSDRPHIFRTGDLVRPLRGAPQVIADYRTQGTKNQLVPPWQIVEEIRKSEDFTGRTYGPEADLEVMDVSVSQLPDHDYAVWLRVTPVD